MMIRGGLRLRSNPWVMRMTGKTGTGNPGPGLPGLSPYLGYPLGFVQPRFFSIQLADKEWRLGRVVDLSPQSHRSPTTSLSDLGWN
jgi:hypothetical protein